MPGFVNCHYHSELAMGPGLYQHIFEKAKLRDWDSARRAA
jgi:5-methylthioadenosine/S-adenosylhomocysteine deaminase